MKRMLKKTLWFVLAVLPVLVIVLIILAWTTEYDYNIAFFILAAFTSLVTLSILLMLWFFDRINFKKRRYLRYYGILLGTPIPIILILLYIGFLQMRWQWSGYDRSNNPPYDISKKQNYFKSQYFVVIEPDSNDPDTIISTVNRQNEATLINVVNGEWLTITPADLKGRISKYNFDQILKY